MNQMGFVTYLQGPYDDAMADVGTTMLEFTVPDSGNVLLMAQATALCDDSGSQNHTGSRQNWSCHSARPVSTKHQGQDAFL